MNTSRLEASTQREIAIFWDYENVTLPSWCKSAADASKAIVDAVSKYGRIVDRRLYFDFKKEGGDLLWSELDSSGFDLVNTPRRNQKETLDKKLITDILTFAWDSAVRNDNCKPCVVLLTSDGDYGYTLSKLRDRGVKTVVIYGKECFVADALGASADIPLSFEDDVLAREEEILNSSTRPEMSSGSGVTTDYRTASNEVKDGGATRIPLAPTSTPTSDALILCKAVANQESLGNGWLNGGAVALCFKNAIIAHPSNEEGKERFRKARDQSVSNGWIERGRRRLGGSEDEIVVLPPDYNYSKKRDKIYSLEDYVRLTPKGMGLDDKYAVTSTSSNSNTSTHLFFTNYPRSANIKDFVSLLERTHNCQVLRASKQLGNPKAAMCFARVQVETPEQAMKLIRLAKTSDLVLQGRPLGAVYDKNIPTKTTGHPEHYYEQKSHEKLNGAKQTPTARSLPLSNEIHGRIRPPSEISDDATFCSILYQIRSGVALGSSGDWLPAGIVGGKFKVAISIPGEPGKERYRNARDQAIDKGLVQMGRRKLNDQSTKREVVVVPRSSPPIAPNSLSHNGTLSTDTLLRLTGQGIALAEESLPRKVSSVEPKRSNDVEVSERSVHLSNLPVNTCIQELVHFIESKHSISIYRACTVKPHPKQKFTSIHIELQNNEDATKIIEISREMQGTGLVYGGRAIHAVPDRTIPDWTHWDRALLYERNVGTESKLSQEKSDAFTEPATAESTTAESETAEPATAEPTTAKSETAEPATAEPTTAESETAEPAAAVDPDTENQETMDLFLEISATMQAQNDSPEGKKDLDSGPSALNTTQDTEMPTIDDPELASGNETALDQNGWRIDDVEEID